jgi:hypothetical protein
MVISSDQIDEVIFKSVFLFAELNYVDIRFDEEFDDFTRVIDFGDMN